MYILKVSRAEAEKLWLQLGDIPIDADECITEEFVGFQPGTPRKDIWHWFEDTFDLSVAEDLMCLGQGLPYDPFEDKDLIKNIGTALSRLARKDDDEFDREPDIIEDDAVWYLRFGDLTEGSEDTVCVDFRIMDSVHWDGTGDPEYSDEPRGFNVGWDACLIGGATLAGCVPYNYTKDVWTRDKTELWDRMEGTLSYLKAWVAEKGWED